jgi:hypothetical protein
MWTFPLWIVLIGLVLREALLRKLEDYPRKKGFISFLVISSALVGLMGAASSISSEWTNLSAWNIQVWFRFAFIAARYVTFAYAFVLTIAILFLRIFAPNAATTPNSSRNSMILLFYLVGLSTVMLLHNLFDPSFQSLLFDASLSVGIAAFAAWTLTLTRAGERRPRLGEPDTAMQEAREELESVVRLGGRLWDRRDTEGRD